MHQCNCVTRSSAGLAHFLFQKFPYANAYIDGSTRTPGTIQIRGDPSLNQRLVVNLFSQYNPGGVTFHTETESVRLKWFKDGLNKLANIRESLESVAFPYLIGCGLAGGDWNKYQLYIEEFANQVAPFNVKVSIVKLP